MNTTRLILTLATVCALASSVFAPSFAVLLGESGDTEAADADHKDWVEIQSIAWTPGAAKDGAAVRVAAPAAASTSDKAKGIARREFEPVVLTVPVEGRSARLKNAFTKGRKLGTIRLRDGDRILVLHEVVVADVTRDGASESISLNYTKIENARVPERAKARVRAGEKDSAPGEAAPR